MSETLEQFIARKSDPKWKPKALPRPSTKIRKFNAGDVARDMAAYEYNFGMDYRTVLNGSQLTLQGWLDAKAGQRPYKAKKLPTLGKPTGLTDKARAEEARAVQDWIKLTPEVRARNLETARRSITGDWG